MANPKVLDDPKINIKLKLSALWIFLMFNYAYGDIMTLIEGAKAPFEITPEFLLGASVYIQISMLMIVLCLFLKPMINRWVNIIAALLSGAGLIASMFVGVPSLFYIFLGIVEVTTFALIIYLAWKWPTAQGV